MDGPRVPAYTRGPWTRGHVDNGIDKVARPAALPRLRFA